MSQLGYDEFSSLSLQARFWVFEFLIIINKGLPSNVHFELKNERLYKVPV